MSSMITDSDPAPSSFPSTSSSSSSSSPPLPLSASSLYLTFDPPPQNTVEEAGQNHYERFTPSLSSVEKFYVAVAQSFAQQEIDRRKADEKKAEQRKGKSHPSPSSLQQTSSTLILQNLSRASDILDHFLAMIDNLLSRRQLSLAFTSPSRDPNAEPEDPSSPAFLLTRRNRLAVLLSSHSSSLSSTASHLLSASSTLRSSLRLHHRYMADLSCLASHWLVRHKPTSVAAIPPLMVEVGIEEIGGGGGGRIMLRRDDEGRVTVDEGVGKRMDSEEEDESIRQRRRKERQQRREERRKQMEDEWQEEMKTTELPFSSSSSSLSPSPSPSSSSGWQATATRLHIAQRHLLHSHLHSLIMREAQSFTSPLCTVSVVHTRITVESSAFPTLWIDWDDGPNGPFTCRTASTRLTALVEGDTLHRSLISILLSHYTTHSSSNRPLILAALADGYTTPAHPPLLQHCITCVYHAYLVWSIRRMLVASVLPFPLASLYCPAPPQLNVFTFTIHRGGLFMLQCTVVGTDMTVTIRNTKLSAHPGSSTGSVELICVTSLSHLQQLVDFAVQHSI